ncbi:acyl-CoA thioesterase [Geobacter argillaceus]|uniref:Acyl-CoA thioester hydrolase n=1 Tax=Geobacter argillaceus TaxID=345631 RepID=A0A562VQ53_9BACT|nr:acyl-CoA thioesterase [Geobacter argillaceus]TWJ19857.1 acyl-CoA thioester hydrolase [Geobacter argillaceus]
MAKRYDIPIEMRFSDLDLYGHVNGVVYFDYLEAARVRLLSEQFRELTDSGIQLLVARAECDYKVPILYGDTVVVSVTIARIGGSSFDLEYCIHDRAGKTFATAKTVMVCYDSVSKTTTTVPDTIKAMAE